MKEMKTLLVTGVLVFISQSHGNVDNGECSAPAMLPTAFCAELQSAWVYNSKIGKCEVSSVCPSTGPNKYQNQIDCEIMCEGQCSAPAYHPQFACFAVEYTWRFNGKSCEYVTACPSNGANRFTDEQACQVACGGGVGPEKCSAPPILPNGRCIEQTAWVYNSDSGICEETNVCPLTGPNKYPDMQTCIDNCVPNDCLYPEFEPECYSGDMWRFHASSGQCNKEGICGNSGQNKFETQALCIETCTSGNSDGVCSAPPTLSTCIPDANDKAWVFSPDSGKCEETNVCPLTGPNKYPDIQTCVANCVPKYCISPEIEPTYLCLSHEVWRYDTTSGRCNKAGVCGYTGNNKFQTETSCLNYCTKARNDEDLCSSGALPTEFCYSMASGVTGGGLVFLTTLSAMLEFLN